MVVAHLGRPAAPLLDLFAGTFVNRIGYVVEPFLALYLAGPRRLTPATVGVVLACFGAGSLVSQFVGEIHAWTATQYGEAQDFRCPPVDFVARRSSYCPTIWY